MTDFIGKKSAIINPVIENTSSRTAVGIKGPSKSEKLTQVSDVGIKTRAPIRSFGAMVKNLLSRNKVEKSLDPLDKGQIRGGRQQGALKSDYTRQHDTVASKINKMITFVEDKKYISSNTTKEKANEIYNEVKGTLITLGDALNILSVTPATQEEMQDVIKSMGEIVKDLNTSVRTLAQYSKVDSLNDYSKNVKEMADILTEAIGNRSEYLTDAVVNSPMSDLSVFWSKKFSTEGAIAYAEKLQSKYQKGSKEFEVFSNVIEGLKVHKEDMFTHVDPEVNLSREEAAEIMGSKKADKGIVPEKLKVSKDHDDSPVGKDGKPKTQEELDLIAVRKMESGLSEQLANGEPVTLPRSERFIREDGMLELVFRAAFKEIGQPVPEYLRANLLEHRLDALNKQPWEPISKNVQLVFNGLPANVVSKITPQSNLGPTDGQHKVFGDMKGGGVVCHMARSYEHVTSLAHCQIQNADGKVLFDGTRHGTIAPYDISSTMLTKISESELRQMVTDLLHPSLYKRSGPGNHPDLDKTIEALLDPKKGKKYREECARDMREAGALRRAEDVTKSVLVKNDDKFKKALNGEVVEININSIGLVTPSDIGNIVNKSSSVGGNEKKMLATQLKAWDDLNNGPNPRDIKVIDPTTGLEKTVKVKVNVTAFNFGVNAMGLGTVVWKGISAPNLDMMNGWNNVETRNKNSMAHLMGSKKERADGEFGGRVGEWLKANANQGASPERIAQVKELARQIGEMFDNGSYKVAGTDPYKMVARLAVLTYFLGDEPCWNCKSGKDRTGETHVEASLLAAEIEMTGKVPLPDRERTDGEKGNLFRMATEGGNLEIQRYNTGAAGFKLTGVEPLNQLFNIGENSKHMDQFNGLARHYGA